MGSLRGSIGCKGEPLQAFFWYEDGLIDCVCFTGVLWWGGVVFFFFKCDGWFFTKFALSSRLGKSVSARNLLRRFVLTDVPASGLVG